MGTSQALKDSMASCGVSIRELGRRTGLSLETIRRMRRIDNYGMLNSWLLVSDALEVPLSVLVGQS